MQTAAEIRSDLPTKENKILKKIIKCYESKNFKIGLKFCKQILSNKNLENHGETLSMKALLLSSLNKKEEAQEVIKLALKYDIKNYVCWHAYGLIQKADGNLEGAYRCFKQALKFQKDNTQILRDLSSIQIHLGEYVPCCETRLALLKQRPGNRNVWLSYGFALQMSGQSSSAFTVIEDFLNAEQSNSKTSFDSKYSNIILYQIKLLFDQLKFEEALSYMGKYSVVVLDKITLSEYRVRAFLKLNREKEAFTECLVLLKYNPENRTYYEYMENSVKASTSEAKHKMYSHLCKLFPKAHYPRVAILKHSNGEILRKILLEYSHGKIIKGHPNLFSSLIFLYQDPQKTEILQSIMLNFADNVNDGSALDQNSILWVYYFLSKHYYHLGDYKTALLYTDKVIDNKPDIIDVNTLRLFILKKVGDATTAIKHAEFTNLLDISDRYLNSECGRLLIKCHRLVDACSLMKIFARDLRTFVLYMSDTQCLWFHSSCAKMFYQKKDIKSALTICHTIFNLFKSFSDDQYDYHAYCMRQTCLVDYEYALKRRPLLKDNYYYNKISRIAIKCYLANQYSSYYKSRCIFTKAIDCEAYKDYALSLMSDEVLKLNEPMAGIGMFIPSLLQMDSLCVANHYLAFDSYLLSGHLLLLCKSLLKIRSLSGNEPKSIYYYSKFLIYYSANISKFDRFSIEVMSNNFKDLIAPHKDPLSVFNVIEEKTLSRKDTICLKIYSYLVKVSLGLISLSIDSIAQFMEEGFESLNFNYSDCYYIFKELVELKEVQSIPEYRKILIHKIVDKFPGCELNAWLSLE